MSQKEEVVARLRADWYAAKEAVETAQRELEKARRNLSKTSVAFARVNNAENLASPPHAPLVPA